MLIRLLHSAVLIVIVALAATAGGAKAATPQSPSSVFTFGAARTGDGEIHLTWTVKPGNYLYREKFVVGTQAGAPVHFSMPAGETKDDPNFGPTEVFHDRVEARIAPEALRGAERLRVTYQGCAERGICYPPLVSEVDLATLTIADATSRAVSASDVGWGELDAAPRSMSTSALAVPGLSSFSSGWGTFIAAFVGFGLLLAFTPCVLPMVPILAGVLSHSGERLRPLHGFALSSTYAFAMALAYSALGLVAAWSGKNLQIVLQRPEALVPMAAVFVALALSSFGLYDLRLPTRWTEALSGSPTGRFGPFGGAALLGFTSALIVGPCVTPPLAGALLYIGQTGDIGRGVAALFAFGMGMGLPLVAVGTFGAGILPRSGPWLLISQKVFGTVFLALAIALLGRILPHGITLALWALLLTGVGVFTGAFDQLRHEDGAITRLSKSFGLASVVYGATLIVGAAGGSDDPLRPLAFLANNSTERAVAQVSAKSITTSAAFEGAMRDARAAGRPILVEFSAEWCTACKSVEREVLADPAIRRRLGNVSVIRADVTEATDETAALMRRFDVVGPPTLLFLRPTDGMEIAAARSVGETTVEEFGRKLDAAGV